MASSNDRVWERYEAHILNEGWSKNRQKKLKQMFTTCARGLKVPYQKATRADIEDFVNRLHRGEFTGRSGEPYSGSSKADMKKFLKQFYKWFKGDGEFHPKEVSWIKARIPKGEEPDEKTIITRQQAVELASSMLKVEQQAMTLLLFDSGFRIGEMFSVTKADLTWEEYDTGRYCWWLKCNASKTFTRKVDVPLFTEHIQRFVDSEYYRALGADDRLFGFSAATYRNRLRRHSEKVLGTRLTPHALRHSSATFWAKEYQGDLTLLAPRFGWSYSAREMKTYVRMSGATGRRAAKRVYTNDVAKLREENAALKERLDQMESLIHAVESRIIKGDI